jgi:3'-phosphoadenosine 5'-phosphosulfate (PAPS) 3'-phosphatase
MATSLNHYTKITQEVVDQLQPVQPVKLGGAGYKSLNFLMGNIDGWIHATPGLGNWDLCAPESLLKSVGGFGTDIFGNRLKYPIQGDQKIKGIMMAKSPQIHNLMQYRMERVIKKVMTSFKL